MTHILLVEDDPKIRLNLTLQLEDEGFGVTAVDAAERALALLRDGVTPNLLLSDVRLPGASGVELVNRLVAEKLLPPTIIISGEATISETVTALQLGVHDFLEKPFSRARLLQSVRNCLKCVALESRVRELEQAKGTPLLGESPAMRRLKEQIAKVAPTEGRVLILGESGTGKELVANAIHTGSQRDNGPFVKMNCASIPANLIESELFGHMRGAFTGAVADQSGLFEEADGGTLFLDEIGDMDLALQTRLLRVLEDGVVRRVGGRKDIRVNVRVVSATHRDLKKMTTDGSFREDLYFRLATLPLHVPSLAQRDGDIVLLLTFYLERYSRQNGYRSKSIAPNAVEALRAYPWPGNVRELRNLAERLVILGGDPIGIDDLPGDIFNTAPSAETGLVRLPGPNRTLPLKTFKTQCEKEYLEAVLRTHGWNYAAAADALDIQRTYLHRKITQLNIQRPGK